MSFGGEQLVEIFGKDHLSLFGLFMKNIVGQRLAFVKQGNVLLGIGTNRNDGLARGIGGTFGLDLIDDIFKLHGQAF